MKNSFSQVRALNLNDPRWYQMAFQFVFLMIGLIMFRWDLSFLQWLSAFSGCLITQLVVLDQVKSGWKSAVITSCSLALMLRSDSWWPFLLAAVLSILIKIIMVDKKHFFNPSNFGICMTILLTGQAWISPGQWGNDTWTICLVMIAGWVVLMKVGRLDSAIGFLAAYCGLHLYRQLIFQEWPFDHFIHSLTNGSMMLFAFFMITDPVPTPSNRSARILWSVAVGVLAWWLQVKFWVNGSPLWALFMLSPLTPAINHFFPGKKFQWNIRPASLIQISNA